VRSRRVQPSGTWHLDEVFVGIGGKRTYLWRAVDDEGEVLEVLAQSRRNQRAAHKFQRKLLKKQGHIPDQIVMDKLGSYSAALRELGLSHLHIIGGRLNIPAEVSHPLPSSGLFAKPREGACADKKAEWDGSNRPDQCSDFCLFTTLSTAISIYNVIESLAELSVRPAAWHSLKGSKLWLLDLY